METNPRRASEAQGAMTTPQPAAPPLMSAADLERFRRTIYQAKGPDDGLTTTEQFTLMREVDRLRSEVAAARNVTLREVLAYEAGQGASIPADLEAAARLSDEELNAAYLDHDYVDGVCIEPGHDICPSEARLMADAQLAKALRLAGARMRALEQVHALVVQEFFKDTASDAPAWRSCRLCSWTWRAGAKEVHEATCPMNALLAPEATDGA